MAALARGDPMAAARAASSNQLGVLEYCRSQGDVGSDAITAQLRVIAQLPGADADQAAEALGTTGTISANGTNLTLASLASRHNTTIAAPCKQMASTVTQAAQSMPAGAISTMRSGMPTMPAM
jgi:hypothetical protein